MQGLLLLHATMERRLSTLLSWSVERTKILGPKQSESHQNNQYKGEKQFIIVKSTDWGLL